MLLSQVPHCPTVAPLCLVTYPPLCPPPQGGYTLAPPCVSVVTHCPTVAPVCGNQGAVSALPCPTVAPMCANYGPVSVVTHCPTVAPVCANYGPVSVATQCPSVSPVCGNQGAVSALPCPTVAPMCSPTQWQCTVHPTLWTQFCHTAPNVCPPSIGCPPNALAVPAQGQWVTQVTCTQICPTTNCPPNQAAALGQPPLGPTGIHYCTQSPDYCGNTAWQGCTQHGCPPLGHTAWLGCPPIGYTAWLGCGTLGNEGPTGVLGCTQSVAQCGNTAWQPCPPPQGTIYHTQLCPTAVNLCPITVNCPPNTAAVPDQGQAGPTGVHYCTQLGHCDYTVIPGCGCLPLTVGPVTLPACPTTPVTQPPRCFGPTGVQHCTQSPAYCGNTAWHGCTQYACPPIGPTAWQGCPPTHMPGCTCLPMTVGPVMTVAGYC